MIWVEQPNGVGDAGCGIASLAMLLETTYQRIVAQCPQLCGTTCGVRVDVMDEVLAENGYAVQRMYRHKIFDRQRRAKWPVRPWADKHLVMVYPTRNDMDARQDEEAHYVVMDREGTVLDPADAAPTPSKLSRYYRVAWIAAVVPLPI